MLKNLKVGTKLYGGSPASLSEKSASSAITGLQGVAIFAGLGFGK